MPSITLSGGVLTLTCSSISEQKGHDTITLTVNNNTGGVIASIRASNGTLEQQSFSKGAVNQIQVAGSIFGNDTFNVLETVSGAPVTISEASGPAVVNIGPFGGLAFINGKVDVQGNLGGLTVNIDDQSAGGGYTYTVAANQVTRSGGSDTAAPIVYNDVSNLNLLRRHFYLRRQSGHP